MKILEWGQIKVLINQSFKRDIETNKHKQGMPRYRHLSNQEFVLANYFLSRSAKVAGHRNETCKHK